jgi:P27 family predicted phage terminase small subunit
MPRGLSDEAKKVWRYLVPKLDDLGLVTPVDQPALEVLCDAVAQYRAAMTFAAKGTLVAGRRKGEAVRNPALLEARQWAGVIAAYSSRFGLSPADRVRLATGGPQTLDELESVLAADTWPPR